MAENGCLAEIAYFQPKQAQFEKKFLSLIRSANQIISITK